MMKLSLGLLVAATTSVLSGCALYFGEDHDDDTWTYCGSDGYYSCEDEDCQWVSATCPDPGWGSGGGSSGGGFECTDNNDCAAGCYCADTGLCEEAGFCTTDEDCGEGYTCNEARSSCEPDTGPTTCDYDNECQEGQYCAPDHTCVATCVCTDDASAQAEGFGWCDETRNTCLPGEDPAGTCGGEAAPTCNLGRPACPAGSVAELFGGCWTGECRAINACDVDPVCEHIIDSASCLARTDCGETRNGVNCTKPDGMGGTVACQDGDTGCSCESYVFASCKTN